MISSLNFYQLYVGIILSIGVVYFSYKFKFLNKSGSVATFILAVLVFGFGGWQWSIPILVFFILSSLLSKTGKQRKLKFKDTFEKSGIRDYTQVISNGGLAAIYILVFIFSADEKYFEYYLVALASATADTWATEIGILLNTKPRLITTFKKVNPGVSGAISIPGTLASFMGSLILVLSGYFFVPNLNLLDLLILSAAGFSGSIFDSILGATYQAQYQCINCESYTEKKIHCESKAIKTRGFTFLNNDMVNILSSLLAVIFYYFISKTI